MSVTFGLAKSRHFYHILLYMSMCIFVYFFYVNNTAKGNTSLMLNKLLLLLLFICFSNMPYATVFLTKFSIQVIFDYVLQYNATDKIIRCNISMKLFYYLIHLSVAD